MVFKSISLGIYNWDSLILLTKVKRMMLFLHYMNLDTGLLLWEKSRELNKVICKEKVLWEIAKTENLQEKFVSCFIHLHRPTEVTFPATVLAFYLWKNGLHSQVSQEQEETRATLRKSTGH